MNEFTKLVFKVRNCKKYLDWKKQILERDDFTCQACGLKGSIQVHHIIPLSILLKENNYFQLNDFRNIIDDVKIWNKSNAISLCHFCHYEIHGY